MSGLNQGITNSSDLKGSREFESHSLCHNEQEKIKVCTKCSVPKVLSEFRKDCTKSDGRQSYCRECASQRGRIEYVTKHGDRVRNQTRVRRESHCARLEQIKSNTKCYFCKESESVALAFHHKDPKEKDFHMAANYSGNWESIENEISKCVVACHNCHTKIHAGLLALEGDPLVCSFYDGHRKLESERTNANRADEQRSLDTQAKLSAIKQSGCLLCLEKETTCLSFHHKDPSDKKFGVGQGTNRAWEVIAAEVAKCVILCKNCHAKVHANILSIPSFRSSCSSAVEQEISNF